APRRRVRLLAALLLFTLACGTVTEFTHSHRDRASRVPATIATTNFDDSGALSAQSDQRSGTSSRSKTSAECLICHLHQNLSNTYFTHELAVAPTETHAFAFSTTVNFYRDDFSTGLRGRAPPAIL